MNILLKSLSKSMNVPVLCSFITLHRLTHYRSAHIRFIISAHRAENHLLFVAYGSIDGSYTNPAYRDETLALLAKIWLKVVPNTA